MRIGPASFTPRQSREVSTKPPIFPNFSTRSKSTRRSTSRCGPSIAGSGSSASPLILDSCSLRNSGRNSRTKPTRERKTSAPSARDFDVLRDAGKLGAVLLQFPFSFHRTEENIAYLNKLLKQFSDYPLVVEVRHATWNEKSFYAMLHERGVGFCNIDQPVIGRSMKPSERSTARVAYVRLHGRRYDTWFSDDPAMPPSERYNYLYTEQELEPWAARIRHLAEERRLHFRHHQQSFRGQGNRECPATHPPAHTAQK